MIRKYMMIDKHGTSHVVDPAVCGSAFVTDRFSSIPRIVFSGTYSGTQFMSHNIGCDVIEFDTVEQANSALKEFFEWNQIRSMEQQYDKMFHEGMRTIAGNNLFMMIDNGDKAHVINPIVCGSGVVTDRSIGDPSVVFSGVKSYQTSIGGDIISFDTVEQASSALKEFFDWLKKF